MKEEEKTEPSCVKIESGIAPNHGLVLGFYLSYCILSDYFEMCLYIVEQEFCFLLCYCSSGTAVGVVIKMKFQFLKFRILTAV